MNVNELLPIGSIVLLEGAEKKLMIFGVGQTQLEENKDFDYIGVVYPEGNMGEGSQFLFNHSDIEEIVFRGYEDEERDNFLEMLNSYFEEKRIKIGEKYDM